MKKPVAALSCWPPPSAQPHAGEGPVPVGVPHLTTFVIGDGKPRFRSDHRQPNAPFINAYALNSNLAVNYYAVAHPSLTNYLEVVGGSNFGVLSDNYPDWHNFYCATNLASGVADTDTPASPAICPIAGAGTDAATPAVDTTNEVQGTPGENNIDGTASIAAAPHVLGKSIGDQLAEAGLSWKSYQESLPPNGADDQPATVSSPTRPISAIQPGAYTRH